MVDNSISASMSRYAPVLPVVKWVGGKRQLLPALTPLLPSVIDNYCEPFVGGGALLFHVQPPRAVINDINTDVIGLYRVIKNEVEALISELEQFTNDEECFYSVRSWDRDKEKYHALPDVLKAARTLYLNKTCYNGLFRVNSAGEFNTPFGSYHNPNIVNAAGLRAVSAYFNRAHIELMSTDYSHVLASIPPGTFVYLDPPYDPVSVTANFTGYSKDGFTRADQIRLRECCDELHERGIQFMLSNSDTEFIREQYQAYNITIVQAKRAINSVGTKRSYVNEIVVRNYE